MPISNPIYLLMIVGAMGSALPYAASPHPTFPKDFLISQQNSELNRARKASSLALTKYRAGALEEAVVHSQTALSSPLKGEERLQVLINYLFILNFQERFQQQQLNFFQKDGNIQLVADLNRKISQTTQRRQNAIWETRLVLEQLEPSLSVALAHILLKDWDSAQSLLAHLPSHPQKIPLYLKIAPHHHRPLDLLEKALSEADPSSRVHVLTALAQLDSSYLSQAISEAQAQLDDESLFQLYALQAKYRPQFAQKSLRLAISSLSRLRSQLASPHPYTNIFFREKVTPVYRNYLTLLLKNPTQNNLEEARQIFDRLQIATVENLLSQVCLTSENKELLATLSKKQAALIQLIVLEDAYHVLLTLPSGNIQHHLVNLSEEALAQQLISWGQQLKDPHFYEFTGLSTQFYDEIIRPLKPSLEKEEIQQLIFIGDEGFRNVPPQAFWDSQKQQFLIEQFTITQNLTTAFIKDIPLDINSWVGYGLSQAKEPYQTSLPFVKPEIYFISELLSNSRASMDEEFTQSRVEAQLQQFNPTIAHFATHAQFTGDPNTSLLLTYDNNLNLFELERLLRLSPQLRFLVLSACETSQSNNLATLGLAGVAAQAQIPFTLGTLWKGDDQSMQQSMSLLYLLLREGMELPLALRRTQMQQIDSGQHPRNWALFLLLGS